MDDATLRRFADVIVGFGANVQPGQVVAVSCEPGKEYMVRAIAESAYRRGAKFVDVQWFDPWVKRTRVEYAREEDLDFIPDWHGKRLLALGEIGAARVGLSGPIAPGLMEDLQWHTAAIAAFLANIGVYETTIRKVQQRVRMQPH